LQIVEKGDYVSSPVIIRAQILKTTSWISWGSVGKGSVPTEKALTSVFVNDRLATCILATGKLHSKNWDVVKPQSYPVSKDKIYFRRKNTLWDRPHGGSCYCTQRNTQLGKTRITGFYSQSSRSRRSTHVLVHLILLKVWFHFNHMNHAVRYRTSSS